jgi:myb proto-oncogene protein
MECRGTPIFTQEDHTILNLVGEHGLNDWTRIAEKLREEQRGARRSGKQCRERWYNHLNPSVNKQPWSSEE